VSPWKVILATLAIFCTGLITGAVLVRQAIRPSPASKQTTSNTVLQPGPLRAEFVHRMTEELNLTPEQQATVLTLVRESQERSKLIYGLISEDLRDEMRQTSEAIRKQLTADQAPKFDQMLKRRARIIEALRANQNDGGMPPRFRQRPFFNRQDTGAGPASGSDPAPSPPKQ
jgi:hypothetical protein